MTKKQSALPEKKSELSCPQCRRGFKHLPDFPDFVLLSEQHRLLPQAGDLTQCDYCGAMLEYWPKGTSLTLQPARPERVTLFNDLARTGPLEDRTPALLKYLNMYR